MTDDDATRQRDPQLPRLAAELTELRGATGLEPALSRSFAAKPLLISLRDRLTALLARPGSDAEIAEVTGRLEQPLGDPRWRYRKWTIKLLRRAALRGRAEAVPLLRAAGEFGHTATARKARAALAMPVIRRPTELPGLLARIAGPTPDLEAMETLVMELYRAPAEPPIEVQQAAVRCLPQVPRALERGQRWVHRMDVFALLAEQPNPPAILTELLRQLPYYLDWWASRLINHHARWRRARSPGRR